MPRVRIIYANLQEPFLGHFLKKGLAEMDIIRRPTVHIFPSSQTSYFASNYTNWDVDEINGDLT